MYFSVGNATAVKCAFTRWPVQVSCGPLVCRFGMSSEMNVTCPWGAVPVYTVEAVQHHVTLCPHLNKQTNVTSQTAYLL